MTTNELKERIEHLLYENYYWQLSDDQQDELFEKKDSISFTGLNTLAGSMMSDLLDNLCDELGKSFINRELVSSLVSRICQLNSYYARDLIIDSLLLNNQEIDKETRLFWIKVTKQDEPIRTDLTCVAYSLDRSMVYTGLEFKVISTNEPSRINQTQIRNPNEDFASLLLAFGQATCLAPENEGNLQQLIKTKMKEVFPGNQIINVEEK